MQLIKSKQIESLAADKIIETNVRKFVTEEQILRWDTGAGSSGTPGQDGKNIELTKNDTHILWRVEGEAQWQELVSLADITGAAGQDGIDGQPGQDGTNGREIELRKSLDAIEWRYADSDPNAGWNELVPLADLTADIDTSLFVLKEQGKDLSSNDYTSEDKNKVDSIISSGAGNKYLSDDGTYKEIKVGDIDNLATKQELQDLADTIPVVNIADDDIDIIIESAWRD